MKVIVGLGNIGSEYAHTRHNIGFDVVDAFEPQLERATGWKPGKGDYYFSKGFYKSHEVILVKPTTYMNLSGRAVQQVLSFYKAEVEDLLVITDDIAIPLGKLRLRLSGSDGGHNGLASIIQSLGTNQYARLRCGVGADFPKGQQARYVLSKFKLDEQSLAKQMIDLSVMGCKTIIEFGFDKAMNVINLPEPKPEKVVKPEQPVKKESSPRRTGDGVMNRDSGTAAE
jgi:peptidyl-tRNA hydrolase, PTH1 family